MVLSYIVYTFLAFVVCSFTNIIINSKSVSKYYLILPISIYSIIVGLRYEVGTDWFQYRSYFELAVQGYSLQLEPCYTFINYIVASITSSYQVFFILVALLQILLIYKSFRHLYFLLPLAIYFFFCGPFFSTLNLLRQSISFCIFLFSIPYIINRQPLKYFLMITIDTTSALRAAEINADVILRKKVILIGLMFVTIILGNVILKPLADIFFSNIESNQYLRYAKGFEDNTFDIGLGYWIEKIVDIILVFYAYRMHKKFHGYGFSIYFLLFFVGELIKNLGEGNQLTIRISYCLTSLRFVIISFLLYYIYKVIKRQQSFSFILATLILLFYTMTFFTAIAKGQAGCSPFQFAI